MSAILHRVPVERHIAEQRRLLPIRPVTRTLVRLGCARGEHHAAAFARSLARASRWRILALAASAMGFPALVFGAGAASLKLLRTRTLVRIPSGFPACGCDCPSAGLRTSVPFLMGLTYANPSLRYDPILTSFPSSNSSWMVSKKVSTMFLTSRAGSSSSAAVSRINEVIVTALAITLPPLHQSAHSGCVRPGTPSPRLVA